MEVRYKVYQFDMMNKVWNLLHVIKDKQEAIEHADFWGNYSIVERVDSKGNLDLIYVTGE